jgi:RNA polymerase sigma-70 factor (ECF subfamily)
MELSMSRQAPPLATGAATAPPTDLEEAVAVFACVRPRLLHIARRVVGTTSRAEDVVQDAWLRWQLTDRTVVREPEAFLATTTFRLAINDVGSAYARREVCPGRPVQEAVDHSSDPADVVHLALELERLLSLLRNELPAVQCRAFVLREAFQLPYADIAELIGTTEANARQVVRRARLHLAARPSPQ